MKEFDKIYVINLDEATDRMESVTKELNREEIEFERVSAISGNNVPEELKVKTPTEGWNNNAIGLILTTIAILEEAILNNYTSIFIFEDDAKLRPTFKLRYDQFIKNIPEWKFIHLNATHIVPFKYIGDFKCEIRHATCCQAYGIHKTVMQQYLNELKKFNLPIDEHTAIIHKEGKSYSPLYDIVFHPEGEYSTLREEVVNY